MHLLQLRELEVTLRMLTKKALLEDKLLSAVTDAGESNCGKRHKSVR